MIGVFLLLAAMALAAFSVGGMVMGLRDAPPLGLSLRMWALICIGLAGLGVILLRMGL